ncbi:hypothetical protein [Belliella pelovolcani]|uniref:hypothetical protein n=1 Tax=Belliella pelovolcani TaxID=529505 RepID=UPI00391C039F
MAEEDKKGAAKAAPTKKEIIDTPTAEEQLVALIEENAKIAAQVEALAAELEDAEESADSLDTENIKLKAENETLRTELVEAAETVTELKAQVGDKASSKGPIVKVGGKDYIVLKGFKSRERDYRPEDIAADPKLAKTLIDKNSQLLKLKK